MNEDLKPDEYIVRYGSMTIAINKHTGLVVKRVGEHPKQPNAANYEKRKDGWHTKTSA